MSVVSDSTKAYRNSVTFHFDAFAVQRIEAYPRPRLRLAIAYYATYVALAFAQSLYKLSRSPGIHAFRRQVFTVFSQLSVT